MVSVMLRMMVHGECGEDLDAYNSIQNFVNIEDGDRGEVYY